MPFRAISCRFVPFRDTDHDAIDCCTKMGIEPDYNVHLFSYIHLEIEVDIADHSLDGPRSLRTHDQSSTANGVDMLLYQYIVLSGIPHFQSFLSDTTMCCFSPTREPAFGSPTKSFANKNHQQIFSPTFRSHL